MIFVFSYFIPVDAADVILSWSHELAVNMQTNEVVLFIACLIEFGFWFCFLFSSVITGNQAWPFIATVSSMSWSTNISSCKL